MDNAALCAKMKEVLNSWLEHKRRVDEAERTAAVFGKVYVDLMDYMARELDGAAPGALDSAPPKPVGDAVPVGALTGGLVGPISAATGQRLMELLCNINGGTVDACMQEALTKHVVGRFGRLSLNKLSEAEGVQLVRDFENVIAGKHQMAYDEHGSLCFTDWVG